MKIKEAIEILKQLNPNDEVEIKLKPKKDKSQNTDFRDNDIRESQSEYFGRF